MFATFDLKDSSVSDVDPEDGLPLGVRVDRRHLVLARQVGAEVPRGGTCGRDAARTDSEAAEADDFREPPSCHGVS